MKKQSRYAFYTEQVTKLLLTDPDTGEEMVVSSPIHSIEDGSYWFITKSIQSGNYWKHTIKTEEMIKLPNR